jgi:hypothetical protein
VEGMGCRVGVDSGSGGSVDTGAVVDVDTASVLFGSCVVVFVMDVVLGAQLARIRIIINPVKYNFIERNMLGPILVL